MVSVAAIWKAFSFLKIVKKVAEKVVPLVRKKGEKGK